MSTILFIETSGPYCSLALRNEGALFVESELLERAHNEKVLLMLDSLYAKADISRSTPCLVGFSAGPGSFTGVRIGAAIAQALAFGSGGRVVPLDSSLVLARTARDRFGGKDWLVFIKSRGDSFYCARYLFVDTTARIVVEPHLVSEEPDWVEQIDDSLRIVGAKPNWLDLSSKSVFHSEIYPEAEAALDMIKQRDDEGQSKPPEYALPVYLEGDSPWVKLADRHS